MAFWNWNKPFWCFDLQVARGAPTTSSTACSVFWIHTMHTTIWISMHCGVWGKSDFPRYWAGMHRWIRHDNDNGRMHIYILSTYVYTYVEQFSCRPIVKIWFVSSFTMYITFTYRIHPVIFRKFPRNFPTCPPSPLTTPHPTLLQSLPLELQICFSITRFPSNSSCFTPTPHPLSNTVCIQIIQLVHHTCMLQL